jgi:hypothetical protein
MAERELPSPERLRQLLAYDPETGALTWKPRPAEAFISDSVHKAWVTRSLGKRADGYASARTTGRYGAVVIDRFSYGAHRVAWAIYYDAWPSQTIDHINGLRWDRISNLRDVSMRENQCNRGRSAKNRSGAFGVELNRKSGKWNARIHDRRRCVWLGSYDTFEEAAQVRKDAEAKYGYHQNHGRSDGSSSTSE